MSIQTYGQPVTRLLEQRTRLTSETSTAPASVTAALVWCPDRGPGVLLTAPGVAAGDPARERFVRLAPAAAGSYVRDQVAREELLGNLAWEWEGEMLASRPAPAGARLRQTEAREAA